MLTRDNYHLDTNYLSNSGAVLIYQKSPYHYYKKYLCPDARKIKEAENKSFKGGSALHCLVLEPDYFSKEYALIPAKYRDPLPEDFKYYLTPDEWDLAHIQRDRLMENTVARELLTGEGINEQVYTFFVEIIDDNGVKQKVPFKIKPDRTKGNMIIDVKTTKSAHPDSFGRSCIDYGYDSQSAVYSDGFSTVQGINEVDAFVFACVENNPPYATAVYFAPKEMIQLGRGKYLESCKKFHRSKKTGIWEGYTEDVLEPVRLPKWAFKQF